jgi:hypothetical protein
METAFSAHAALVAKVMQSNADRWLTVADIVEQASSLCSVPSARKYARLLTEDGVLERSNTRPESFRLRADADPAVIKQLERAQEVFALRH